MGGCATETEHINSWLTYIAKMSDSLLCPLHDGYKIKVVGKGQDDLSVPFFGLFLVVFWAPVGLGGGDLDVVTLKLCHEQ